jgi:hypothetical protein
MPNKQPGHKNVRYLCLPYCTVPTNRNIHGVKAHLENPFHDEWAVVPGVRSWTLVDKGAVLLGQGEVFRVRTKADGLYVSVGS